MGQYHIGLCGIIVITVDQDMMRILQPYALSNILIYILSAGDMTTLTAWGWLTVLVLSNIICVFSDAFGYLGMLVVGMAMKTTVSSLIYKKVIFKFIATCVFRS